MTTDPVRLAEELEGVLCGDNDERARWLEKNSDTILAALRAAKPDPVAEAERVRLDLKKWAMALGHADYDTHALDYITYIAANVVSRQVAEAERAEVEAGRAFFKRLRECEDDPRYMAVWTHYAMHGGQYDGPKYSEARNCYTVAIARTDAARKEAGR